MEYMGEVIIKDEKQRSRGKFKPALNLTSDEEKNFLLEIKLLVNCNCEEEV